MENTQTQSNNQFPIVANSTIGRDEVQTVNARELHKFLESKQQFADWIQNRIKQYDFVENVDFITASENYEAKNGGQNRKDFHLTLDMAKELCMVERNDKGKQARSYFIECERRLRDESHTLKALNDPQALRGLLLENVEKVLKLEQQIEQDKPKTQFFDAFVNSEGLYGLQNAARATHHKPNLYIRWLKQNYLF